MVAWQDLLVNATDFRHDGPHSFRLVFTLGFFGWALLLVHEIRASRCY